MNQSSIVYDCVYYVETDSSTVVFNPLAIRPVIRMGRVSWEDTSRGSAYGFKYLRADHQMIESLDQLPSQPPHSIEFIGEDGQVVLSLLTLEVFDQKVRHRVAGGRTLHFKDDDDLQHYFLYELTLY